MVIFSCFKSYARLFESKVLGILLLLALSFVMVNCSSISKNHKSSTSTNQNQELAVNLTAYAMFGEQIAVDAVGKEAVDYWKKRTKERREQNIDLFDVMKVDRSKLGMVICTYYGTVCKIIYRHKEANLSEIKNGANRLCADINRVAVNGENVKDDDEYSDFEFECRPKA